MVAPLTNSNALIAVVLGWLLLSEWKTLNMSYVARRLLANRRIEARMGDRQPIGQGLGGDLYVIMTVWGCEIHLIQAGEGPWRVPETNNPFGVFIRTPDVEAIAARVDDLIIRPGGVLRHREWGLYEFAVSGPDGLLVRIGWPSRLI